MISRFRSCSCPPFSQVWGKSRTWGPSGLADEETGFSFRLAVVQRAAKVGGKLRRRDNIPEDPSPNNGFRSPPPMIRSPAPNLFLQNWFWRARSTLSFLSLVVLFSPRKTSRITKAFLSLLNPLKTWKNKRQHPF